MQSNANEMIANLMNSFKKDNVILYVGRNGRKELTPEICELPWSCMVTSCTDDIGTEFAAQNKEAIRYTSYRKLPNQLFVKNKFPIIQLYGKADAVDEALEEFDEDFLRHEIIKKDAESIFNYIMARMDMRTRMVIIGYAPEDPDEFPLLSIIYASRNMRGGVIDIYGATNEAMMEPLFKTLETRGGNNTSEKILDLISEVSDQSKEYQEIDKKNENIFYKERTPVSIPSSFLLSYTQPIQLLTEETIYEVRPFGKIEQQEWFPNFFNNSSEKPQWYGYLRQSEFYVQRDYENTLISLVRNLLDGRNMKRENNIPVILQGPPGSSKSIEMAALAVKIFEEHVNPVIFINSDKLSFAENSPEMEELDSLMQEVEKTGEKDARFLIIWDSSSYKAVAVNAATMLRTLHNNGRSFVLVCTAYGNDFNVKSLTDKTGDFEWYYYQPTSDKFVKSNTQSGDVFFDGKFYYIHADGKVSAKERTLLDNKIKSYALLSNEEKQLFWDRLEDKDNLFNIFYHLMIALQPKLNISLSREQELVHRFVNQQLGIIDQEQEETVRDDTIFRALVEAGIVLSDEDKMKIEQEDSLDEEFDLNRFTQVIAMFGRFKLDTPFSLAVSALYKDREKYKDYMDTYYGNNSRKLFALLTTEIPFIHYCEGENGKKVFRYRNALEAELFLSRNNIEPKQQVELICFGLDYYDESYYELKEVDDELKSALEKILRMIGPNTDYIDFMLGNLKETEHRMFLSNMEILIQKLADMRMKEIPDTNAGFATIEITFIREYYGKLWDVLRGYNASVAGGYMPWEVYPDEYNAETYICRIKQLKSACNLAMENIKKLQAIIVMKVLYERKYLGDQINGLSVEACLCSDMLKKVWEEYEVYCQKKELPIKINKNDYSPLTYRKQYEMLVKATITAPLNGYAYNALFSAFEEEYKSSDDENRKITLLSEIKMIADEASDTPIVNRGMNGRDDISIHISRIMDYASEIDVTIDSVLTEQTSPFHDLYKKLLEQKNASAICFVCQRELDLAGLGGTSIAKKKCSGEEYILTDDQVAVCKKIMEFMTKDEYYTECVSKNPYALYLLLRVEWMLFNKRPLSATNEYQRTYVTQEQWRKINEICLDYKACAGENIRPIVILIHALSELHLTHNYKNTHLIVNQLKTTDFITTPRMRVPYLVCFEPGKPEEYSGTVISQKNYSGYIQYDQLPNRLGSEVGVRFYMKNMGWVSMPDNGRVLEHIHLGLGFTGFSAYRCDNQEVLGNGK